MELQHRHKILQERLQHEVLVAWHLSRYDLTATVVPATLFLVTANLLYPDSNWLINLVKSLIYFSFYILCFNSSNQSDPLEDELNNKQRALTMGLITQKGSILRWYFYSLTFLLLGIIFHVFAWAACWLLVVIGHNQLKFANNWFAKNALMGLGTFFQLAAAWELVRPLDTTSISWISLISFIIFLVVAVQDLRDRSGDAAVGRRTFPMVFGLRQSKIYFASAMIFSVLLIFALHIYPKILSLSAAIYFSAIAFFALWIAIRLLRLHQQADEAQTYTLLTFFYCFTLPFIYWIY